MKTYKLKFRLEFVVAGPRDDKSTNWSFDFKYYSADPDSDHHFFYEVEKPEDNAFENIAQAITDDFVFSKCSNSDAFIFGVEYFDIDAFFEHKNFSEELKDIIKGVFNRTFNYYFFYKSEALLEKNHSYEYVFDLTFADIDKDLPLKLEKLEQELKKIR